MVLNLEVGILTTSNFGNHGYFSGRWGYEIAIVFVCTLTKGQYQAELDASPKIYLDIHHKLGFM